MRSDVLFTAICSAISFLVGNVIAGHAQETGTNPLMAGGGFAETLPDSLASGHLFYADTLSVAIGVACACAVWLFWAREAERMGNYRRGEEHGSSRWATAKEMGAYADSKDPDNNVILSSRSKKRFIDTSHDQRTETNNNMLVVGGPGTGKTRYYVKPNLYQLNANYFITDPKGTLIMDVGWLFEESGYDILTFDTIDFSRSMHFNPLAYVRDEKGILKFVECLVKNTTGDKEHSGDPFWENAEKLLYTALVGYLIAHCPPEDRNVGGLIMLLALADAREDDEDYMSPLDMLFNEIETGRRLAPKATASAYDPERRDFDEGVEAFEWIEVGKPAKPEEDFSLATYKQFKVAAGKTMKSIMVSCNVRMKPFDIDEVRELLSYDEMDLGHLGDASRKTVVFASMSDTDSTFDFLFALLMRLAMDTLCEVALEVPGPAPAPRPLHVRRVRQHRPGARLRADDHRDAQPQHRRVDDPAVPLAAQGDLRRQQRSHHRQRLRHLHLSRRQVKRDQQGDIGDGGQADREEHDGERLPRSKPLHHEELRRVRARPDTGLRDSANAEGRGIGADQRRAALQGQEIRPAQASEVGKARRPRSVRLQGIQSEEVGL
nr:type IV secretory system conjugative DNA transfer family protein [Trueperella pyogenes]